MAAGPGAPTPAAVPPGPDGPIPALGRYLSNPPPHILLVKGPPGAGKTSLLRALRPAVKGPVLLVAYRATASGAAPGAFPAPDPVDVSLLLIDPDRTGPNDRREPDLATAVPISFSAGDLRGAEGVPPALEQAIGRIVRAGGGCVIVDSWDRSSEEAFDHARAAERGATSQIVSSTRILREMLGRVPVHTVISLLPAPDPSLESLADGVLELGQETVDGATIRVLTVSKLRGEGSLEPDYLYTVAGGEFAAFPRSSPGFRPPFGPPDPDPGGPDDMIWPGSAAFAAAFGRLRVHGLTAVELDDEAPDRLFDVLAVPLVASVVRAGGRAVVVPSAGVPPAQYAAALARFAPTELVQQNVRLLSAGGADARLGDVAPLLLPVRSAPASREGRAATARPAQPMFPEAHEFLRTAPGSGPVLFVVSLDGLEALATVSRRPYDASTFPLVVTAYGRLARFHGFGGGRTRSALTRALIPSVDAHLKIRMIRGRSVVLGIRPRTAAHLLDYAEPDGRYRLRPIA
ncbi:MAG TPA: hypothetical protein VMH78_00580 [Thermoplasmata archaeon]|nr:hypothetical protein [Thermoplasmata archaeon]